MSSIAESLFGSFEGKPVMEYSIKNNNGMQVSIINYGATITKIITADKDGRFENVINNYDGLEGYLINSNKYAGSTVGRYCNRIANGKFTLDGHEYMLEKNNGPNSLHGGVKGFDKMLWEVKKQATPESITLHYLSKDGEEGFPGNLAVTVTFTLSNENALSINYSATTDKPTPVNLTNHCYFNLSGQHEASILDHELQIFADSFTVSDTNLIPSGEIAVVKNTALDFTSLKKIATDIATVGGYDHNMIINKKEAQDNFEPAESANLYDSLSGRYMEMFTSEPAVQFYSGNLHPGPGEQAGLCLEAQHYPDSPNQPSFPNTILRPGEKYEQTTIYKFSVK